MDLQKLINALNATASETRADYHVTLGELTALCQDNPSGAVIVDGEGGLGREDSYRGYYCDLAFQPTADPTQTSEVLKRCQNATQQPYEGYKGGTYRYTDRTPLWLASYGNCGSAIVSAKVIGGDIHLTTGGASDAQ